LLHSPLALAPSLYPLEITLNDICYHQDNPCQLREKTADAGLLIMREWRKENRDKGDTFSLVLYSLKLGLVRSVTGYN